MKTITDNKALDIAYERFTLSIYHEHMDEASFLYEQRNILLNNPAISWLDTENFDNRLDAHIDGLVEGNTIALDVCSEKIREGDPAEVYAAFRVFCRQSKMDWILGSIGSLDINDEETYRAFIDALKHEMPLHWQNEFLQILREGKQGFNPFMAEIIGYKRIVADEELLHELEKKDPHALPQLCLAIGRIREKKAAPVLLNLINDEIETTCFNAALALLRIGEVRVMDHCLQYAHTCSWPFLPIGLGGGSSTVPILLQIASSGNASHDCLLSLGILGDISAVDTLLSHLNNSELAESAVMALNLITGAEIYQDVFIPEEIDEDELFEEEIEKLKRGESLYPEGEEPGETITRLSQSPEDWYKWWVENKSRFKPGIRYRNGKPFSPACLLKNLESETSPRMIRQLAYEELVIRYDIDFPFETDMFVAQQKEAISGYRDWIEKNGNKFQEGKWYFAGRIMHE